MSAHPTGAWTTQAARNLLMDLTDRATSITFLLQAHGSPPGAPRANAICQRMIGTLRHALLDRILVVNERHLPRILTSYLHHSMPRGHTGRSASSHQPPPPMINLAS